VKVLPVGYKATHSPAESGNASLTGPSVLYFNPRQIIAERLPEFPAVYRPEESSPPQSQPEEIKTADVSPMPSALPALSVPPLMIPPRQPTLTERQDQPVPHSEVVLPAPSALVPSEPPMISSLRELEQQIPTPKPMKARKPVKAAPPAPTPLTSADIRDKGTDHEATAKATSWWPYLGLALIPVAWAAIYAGLRGMKKSPAIPPQGFAPVHAAKAEPIALQNPPRKPAASQAHLALDDDILTALVFNQLPIIDETPQPVPPEEKPPSRKIYRLDPPEEQAQAAIKKPHVPNRPQPRAPQVKPGPIVPKDEEPEATLSLLDQVLKRANERRAA
jgi:hypothetical protein